MRRDAKLAGAALTLVLAFAACQAQQQGGASGQPSASLLARGTFTLNDAKVVLDATGTGNSVAGTLTASHSGGDFTVDLRCARSTDDGQLWIGGDVIASTDSQYALKGTRTAIVFKRGTPPLAEFAFQMTDPPSASCLAFFDDVAALAGSAIDFQPIPGTVELAP